MVIGRDQLPEDAADWHDVAVEFPRLTPDSPRSCPATQKKIMEYVRMESADLDEAISESLEFIRTARVGDHECWLWKFTESDGTPEYVTYWRRADGSEVLGLTEAFGLNPEQFILAEYYDEVYWP